MIVALSAGLLAGSLHVFTGPDHLAAVVPLATRDARAAGQTGALWGLGHGSGVVAVGALGLWARERMDIHALSDWSEVAVGLILVGLGLWSLMAPPHRHDHLHDGVEPHAHTHQHLGGARHHHHAAFGVGLLHGSAGVGHLFGVLPALALPTEQAVAYLGSYLFAAVISMAMFGLAVGQVVQRVGARGQDAMRWSAGLLAIGVGAVWFGVALQG
ncbi:MAG: High-affinity nickel transporter [Deltaproteobacteria bacterium]|nr:High-affinity nickel transporter [Deltaproteobacteria bacterium]